MGRTARTKAKPRAKAPIPASPVAAALETSAGHVEHAADQPDYSLYNVRLASFSNSANPWPLATPTPETLAAAGFFHDPFPDESPDSVNCFQCGKPLGDWDPDDDPFKEHVGHTTDCAWARAVCVPEMCRMQGSNPYDLNDPETWPAALERAREETFIGRWPHAGQKGFFATIKRMAKAGFHYTPEAPGDDCASCIYCGTTLSEWSPKDNPLIEHKNRQPDCPFFDRIAKVRGKRPAPTSAPAAAPPPKRARNPPASHTAPPATSAVEDEPVPAARAGRKPPARSVRRTAKASPPEPVDPVLDDMLVVPPTLPAPAATHDHEPVDHTGDAADVVLHPPPVEDAALPGAAESNVEPPPAPSTTRTLRRGRTATRTATRTLPARRASRRATRSAAAAPAEVPAPEPVPAADELPPVPDEPAAMDVDEPVPPPPTAPEPQPNLPPVVTRTTRRGTRTVAASTRSTRRGRSRGRGRGSTRTVPARVAAVVEEEELAPAPGVDAAPDLPADEPQPVPVAPEPVTDDTMDVDRADPFEFPVAPGPGFAARPSSRSRTPTRQSASPTRRPATPRPWKSTRASRVAAAPAVPAPAPAQPEGTSPSHILTPPAAPPATSPHDMPLHSLNPDPVVHSEPTPPPPPRAASPPPLEPPARPKRAATRRRAPARTAPLRVTRNRRAPSPPPAAIVQEPIEDSVPVPGRPSQRRVSRAVDAAVVESVDEERGDDEMAAPVIDEAQHNPTQEPVDDESAAAEVEDPMHDAVEDPAHDVAEELLDAAKDPLSEDPLVEDPLVEDPLAEEPLTEEPLDEEPLVSTTPVPAARRASLQSVPRASPMLVHESRRSSMLLWHTTPQGKTGRSPPAFSMVDDEVELHVVNVDTAADGASAPSTPTQRRSSRIRARASKSPIIDVVGNSMGEDGLLFEEPRRAEPFLEPAGSSSLSAVPQSSSLSIVPSSSAEVDRESAADDTAVPEETPMDVDDDEVEDEEYPDPDDFLPVTPAPAPFVTPARTRGPRGGFSVLRFQVDPTAADTPTRPTRVAARRASTPAVVTANSALGAQQVRKLSTPAPSRRASTPAPARQPAAQPPAETGAELATHAGPTFSTRRKTRLFSPSAAPPPSHMPPPPLAPVQRGARHRSHTAPEAASTVWPVMLRYRVVEIEIPIYVRRGVRTPQRAPVPTAEPRILELVESDREDRVEEDGMGSGGETQVEVEEPERVAEPLDEEPEDEEREAAEQEEDAIEELAAVEVSEAEEEREAAEVMDVVEERDAVEDAGKEAAAASTRDGSSATKDLDMDDSASEPDLVLFLEDEPDAALHGDDPSFPAQHDVAMDEPEELQDPADLADLGEIDELTHADHDDASDELQAMADLHVADDLDAIDGLDVDSHAHLDPTHVATPPSVSPVHIEDNADIAPPSVSPMQIEDHSPAPVMSPIHIEDEDGHPSSPMAGSSTPTPTPTPFAPRASSPAASMYEPPSLNPTPTASRPSTRTCHASPGWHSSPTPSRRRPGSLGRAVPAVLVSPTPALRAPAHNGPAVVDSDGSASFNEGEPAVADADLPAVHLPSANGVDHDGDVAMDEAVSADVVDPDAELRALITAMDSTVRAQCVRAASVCDPEDKNLTVREWLAVVNERRIQAYRAQVKEMMGDLIRKAREAGLDVELPHQ
ncbi:hypothetical protein AMAG_06343 [Allomyces macrogynus ATCC 38327]|uniref:BIR-domain-containing protein n=1 Tax=Allomyces macrogynus (strain ATCC 38327) TaxID=578462 RepID=A0A0L0SG95_ALLM3|nr:hypothetical protein AMAG_06343 [Allomyces macrogynus ATCC 38327]|eukprot:KNE61528.1 hypothetical protein AMAG_06343 [Allomyces macrogynus ATCC 38327]